MGCLKVSERGQIMSLKELKEQLNPEMANDVRDGDNQLNPANKVKFLFILQRNRPKNRESLSIPARKSVPADQWV